MSTRIHRQRRHATAARLAAAVLATLAARQACAQTGSTVPYGAAGSAYSQTFDGLSTNPVTLAYGGEFSFGDGQPGGAAAMGMAGWFGDSATAVTNSYGVGNGAASTGGFYSFSVAGAAPITDKSLGLITTAATGPEIFAVALTNTSGATLTNFAIDYSAETWHSGQSGTSNTLAFGYNLGSATIPTIDASGAITAPAGSYVSVPALSYTVAGVGSSNNAVDGHSAGNNATEAATISGLSWTAGQTLWLTWSIAGTAAKAPGIGIDDLTFSASSALGGPASPIWNAANGVGAWDKTSSNWTGGNPTPGLYKDGDNAIFDDTSHPGTAGGTITVQAGGVSPASTTVTTTGTYTFQNTAGDANGISGSGGLTKVGPGTLVLSSQNTYLGGTTVSAGTLQISNDNNLGAAGTPLIMDNSTLRTAASITFSRPLTFGVNGVTVTTLGNNVTTASATTINGMLTTSGAGMVTLNGPVTFGAAGALSIPAGSAVTLGQTSGAVTLSRTAVINGTLNIAGPIQFTTGLLQGTGAINALSTGTYFGNVGTGFKVVLNSTDPTGSTFVKGDVTKATYTPGTFVTTFGGGASLISGFSDVNIAGSPAGGGTGPVTFGVNGSGFPSTYQGTTTINLTSGTVTLATTNALPVSTDVIYGTETSQATGAVVVDVHGQTQTMGSLSTAPGATGTITITNGVASSVAVLQIGGSTTPANSFAGSINASGTSPSAFGDIALTKIGTNTLTLNGTNTYGGLTSVQGGTLALGPLGSIANSLSKNGVAISAGATLDASQVAAGLIIGSQLVGKAGTGIVNIKGNITMTSGSVISPALPSQGGTNIMAITGNFNLNSGAHFQLNLKGAVAGTSYDQLQVSGNVTLGGDLTGSTVGYTPRIGDILYVILVNGGTTTGTLNGVAQDGLIFFGPQEFKISYDATIGSFDSNGNDVALLAVTPEPGSAMLLLTGLTACGTLRRRRPRP